MADTTDADLTVNEQKLKKGRYYNDEDDVIESECEKATKRFIALLFRMFVACLVLYGVFDFLFSTNWLHGYVWALNQNYTRADLKDQAGGLLLVFHNQLLPMKYKLACLVATIVALVIFLKTIRVERMTMWTLFRVSSLVGILVSLSRCQQESHRIYPTLHEGFYCYLAVFCIGVILMIRFGE